MQIGFSIGVFVLKPFELKIYWFNQGELSIACYRLSAGTPSNPKAKAKSKAKAKAKAAATTPAVSEVLPKSLDDLKAEISPILRNFMELRNLMKVKSSFCCLS